MGAAEMFYALIKIYTEAVNDSGIMNDAPNPPLVKSTKRIS